MTRIKYLVAAATFSLLLAGCSTNNEVPDYPPDQLYATAQKQLQKGNFRGAIRQLEALDNRYPFGSYSQQTQLDLIYAYYKSDELPLAQASIDRFIRLNPTHKEIDYVIYLRGVINMEMDINAMQRFFGIDRSDRDPQFSLAAFSDFTQLIKRYPNSEYAADAKKRMVSIKNRIADYELSVAKYYTKRSVYVAVVNRVKGMLENYPDTTATEKALPLLENAYRKLQLNDEADKTAKLIEHNKNAKKAAKKAAK